MDETLLIRLKAMPLNQDIEEGHCVSQAAFEVGPGTMGDFLEVTNGDQHRQNRLYQHARIPSATLAQLQIGGLPVFLFKARVTQD